MNNGNHWPQVGSINIEGRIGQGGSNELFHNRGHHLRVHQTCILLGNQSRTNSACIWEGFLKLLRGELFLVVIMFTTKSL